MIPMNTYETAVDAVEPDFEVEDNQPTLTYYLQPKTGRIAGKCDGIAAIKQAIYKVLQTERYQHAIYGWRYGVQLDDLYGKHLPYVLSEVQTRITEALLADTRIQAIEGFRVAHLGGSVLAAFTARTTAGLVEIEQAEVMAHV